MPCFRTAEMSAFIKLSCYSPAQLLFSDCFPGEPGFTNFPSVSYCHLFRKITFVDKCHRFFYALECIFRHPTNNVRALKGIQKLSYRHQYQSEPQVLIFYIGVNNLVLFGHMQTLGVFDTFMLSLPAIMVLVNAKSIFFN